MSYEFFVGPNGVEEVEMDEIEEDEAITNPVRNESRSEILVTLPKSKVLTHDNGHQNDDESDGLTWPQITGVRGAITTDFEVRVETDKTESQFGTNTNAVDANDEVSRENSKSVSEQSKIEETTYFMDLESSDSENETIKSEETSEIESMENSCDESASSAINIKCDSNFEKTILEFHGKQIASNVKNPQIHLPPLLELGPWEIDPKTILDLEMPILQREQKLVIPSEEKLEDKTPKVDTLKNKSQQNMPKFSPTIKMIKKRKFYYKNKSTFPSRQPKTCPVEGCGKVLTNIYALNTHIEMQHTQATCEQCNLTFDRIILLTNHMNDVHTPEDRKVFKKKVGRKPQPKPEIPPPPPSYPCSKCPSTFTYAQGLSRHMGRVHGDVFNTSSCYFCSRNFFSYFELSAHMHIHTLEKGHRCYLCAKDFYRKSTLKVHIKSVHAPNGPRAPKPKKYICPTCGKGFGGSGNLKYHVEDVHLKLKAFGCDLCDARFGRKGSLDKHKLAVHKKRRDFVCDRCGKGFSTNVCLKNHDQAVHEKTRHQCPHCDKNYSQRTHLRAHIKKFHK